MTECDVYRMVATETAPEGDQVAVAILEPHQPEHLVENVLLILNLTRDAPTRWHVAVVPTFRIERVDTVELDLTVVDLVADRVHHATVLELIEARLRAGKYDDGYAAVPKDKQLHVPAETF